MILAIDFGGTRIRAAWFEHADDGTLVMQARAEQPTLAQEEPAAVIARLCETAAQVVPGGAVPQQIGIAAPGPLDGRRGVIYHAETLPGWNNVPLAQIVSEHFGAPAFMQNDANLAALAEYRLGAGRGANPMIYLTISTGIGGGAIINGDLYTGWSGLAVEPGHMRFPNEYGEMVRLEALVSGTGLADTARWRLDHSDVPSLLRTFMPGRIDGSVVGAAAKAGDAIAYDIVARAGDTFGLGLVNLFHLFSPEAIVVGGSVAVGLGEQLFEPARRALAEHILDPLFLPPNPIRIAALGDDVCLIGAALWAQEQAGKRGSGTA